MYVHVVVYICQVCARAPQVYVYVCLSIAQYWNNKVFVRIPAKLTCE